MLDSFKAIYGTLLIIFILAILVVFHPSDVNAISTSVCDDDIILIGARGSGQDFHGSLDPSSLGPQVESFYDGLRSVAPYSSDVGMYALGAGHDNGPGYLALNVLEAYLSYDQAMDISVGTGANELVQTVAAINATCLNPPKIILSGYSQGAEVVKRGVNKLTSSQRALVYGIVTIADPTHAKYDGAFNFADSDSNCVNVGSSGFSCPQEGIRRALFSGNNISFPDTLNIPLFTICIEDDTICDFPSSKSQSAGIKIHTDDYQGKGYAFNAGQFIRRAVEQIAANGGNSDGINITPDPFVPGSSSGSSSSTPTYSANELVFFRDTDGRRVYNEVKTDGGQALLAEGNWSASWDNIVTLEIDGDSNSEILFYDAEATSTRGKAKIYNLTETSLTTPVTTHDWSNYWTHFIPIDLDGDNLDELLVYSAINGRYYYLNVKADGSVNSIKSGTWSTGWEIIEAIEFDGTKGSEIFFYKKGNDRGITRFYDVGTTGSISLRNAPNWVNGWTHMKPIDIEGDGTDELILYRATDGRRFVFDIKTNGTYALLGDGYWRAGWDIIEPIEVGDDAGAEVLFYQSDYAETRGQGKIYDMKSTNVDSYPKKTISWSKGWTFIIPTQLN